MSWIDDMPAHELADWRDAGRIGASRFEGPEKATSYRLIEDVSCLLCGAPINVKGDGHEDWCMGFDS